MIKKLMTALIFAFSIMLAHAAPTDAALTQLLINTHTMQANFSQAIWNPKGQLINKSQGKMALERPGKFRWEVTKPMAQLIVANEKKLWIYDKDLEQLTIRLLSNGAGAEPAILLSDANLSLDKDFNVKQLPSTSGTQWFLLTPKDKNTLFTVIKLGFKNDKIIEMQFKDHLAQMVIIKFSDIKTNQPLSSTLFQVHVPANVDIIDETRRR